MSPAQLNWMQGVQVSGRGVTVTVKSQELLRPQQLFATQCTGFVVPGEKTVPDGGLNVIVTLVQLLSITDAV